MKKHRVQALGAVHFHSHGSLRLRLPFALNSPRLMEKQRVQAFGAVHLHSHVSLRLRLPIVLNSLRAGPHLYSVADPPCARAAAVRPHLDGRAPEPRALTEDCVHRAAASWRPRTISKQLWCFGILIIYYENRNPW